MNATRPCAFSEGMLRVVAGWFAAAMSVNVYNSAVAGEDTIPNATATASEMITLDIDTHSSVMRGKR